MFRLDQGDTDGLQRGEAIGNCRSYTTEGRRGWRCASFSWRSASFSLPPSPALSGTYISDRLSVPNCTLFIILDLDEDPTERERERERYFSLIASDFLRAFENEFFDHASRTIVLARSLSLFLSLLAVLYWHWMREQREREGEKESNQTRYTFM